jgi:hypothetical protein
MGNYHGTVFGLSRHEIKGSEELKLNASDPFIVDPFIVDPFLVLYFQYPRTIDVPIITPTATLTYTLSCSVILCYTGLFMPALADISY